jgi:hypothetical protein
MKKAIFILFLSLYLWVSPLFAKEVTLQERIIEQADSGLWTIKIYLAEWWKCETIVENKVIKAWYMLFVDNLSNPLETRKQVFEEQIAPLKKELETLKVSITKINSEIKLKKELFLETYNILNDNEKIIADIKTLSDSLLSLTSDVNIKTTEKENIENEYTKYKYLSREEIQILYETQIKNHCKTWFWKIEPTEKKLLEQDAYDLTNKANIKAPSKYRKILDKITLIYVKNPEAVKKLWTRLTSVLRKLSKENKNYPLYLEMKIHIQELQ